MQMQNLALACQQVVADSQPRHCPQVATHNCVRHNLADLCVLAATLLNRLQCRCPQLFRLRFVLRQQLRRARIQIPAVVIELRLAREHLHADRRALLHLQESDYDVRHLHACIVDVVLHLHAISRKFQNPRERISQHSVPHMPDVRRLVRINTRMLDNNLFSFLCALCVSAFSFLVFPFPRFRPKRRAIEIRIQIARTRDLDPRNPRHSS